MSRYRNYWIERVAESLETYGVVATQEQIASIASEMQGAHECYGQAFYQPENPIVDELRELRAELKREREMVFCIRCQGSGGIVERFGSFESRSQCHKCNGKGRHTP